MQTDKNLNLSEQDLLLKKIYEAKIKFYSSKYYTTINLA